MLLPSLQMRKLSKRFDICLSGNKAPENCDIRYRQFYWLMVFDEAGELRGACKLGEQLSVVIKQGFDVPNGFVELVEQSMRSKSSVQELQRNYIKSGGSLASYETLCAKVQEVHGVGQMAVSTFLEESRSKVEDPVLTGARSLWMEADACSHQVINHAAFSRVRNRLVEFIGEHPKHPFTRRLLEPLVDSLKYSFDVEAKCRAYVDAWADRSDSGIHDELIAALSKRSSAWCEIALKELEELEGHSYRRLRLLAQIGDADGVLKALEATKSLGVMRPFHEEWRREAKAKATGNK